jgi:hypothetical protein
MKTAKSRNAQRRTNLKNAFHDFDTYNNRVLLIEYMLREDSDNGRKHCDAVKRTERVNRVVAK